MTSKRRPAPEAASDAIAIVGAACRLPGASDTAAFWELLASGRDAIGEVPADRWNGQAFFDPDPQAADRMSTKWGGFLDAIGDFDADFFGVSPREATWTDPQQRLLMHAAWEALEDAAIVPSALRGSRTGVYIGASTFDYCQLQLHQPHGIDGYLGTGTTNCILANRLSYFFDFRGPSLAIDTACSSSLVAVHLACQSLRSGESTLALAGGVNVIAWPWVSVAFSKAGFMAADGRCKAFDARADGYVRSEGVGLVVLKRLADAIADGDRIQAVILGSAVNQDGRSNGLTAPNPRAQAAVLRAALADARVSADALQYVEAHGTGTRLGDPIEVKSLGEVLGTTARAFPCRLGSVKSNLGHLEAAAGVASLIKVVLALRHRRLPATLHVEAPNPLIPFDRLPIELQRSPGEWPAPGDSLVAGVSSFGFGGTNAHLVVGEAPAPDRETAPVAPHAIVLSARSRPALERQMRRVREQIAGADEATAADVCHTLRAGRERFAHRFVAVAADAAALARALESPLEPDVNYVVVAEGRRRRRPRVAWLFTGQGSQFPGMARALAGAHASFRRDLTDFAAAVDRHLKLDLLKTILPAKADEGAARERLEETIYTQTSLFCVELALARLLETLGLRPDALFGHSVGEIVAACVAGVFSVEDAIRVVCERARLMQAAPPGKMAAVTGDRALIREIVARYPTTAAVAAHNGPHQTVIAGKPAALDAVCAELTSRGLATVPLAVTRAFHSPLMRDAAAAFERFLSTIPLRAPSIPIHSNTTGAAQGDAMATPAYWAAQMLSAVHFEEAMHALLAAGPPTCIEIGPHPVLSALGATLPGTSNATWLPTLRRKRDDWKTLLGTLRDLELQGIALDWKDIGIGAGARWCDASTYPFESRRYWRGALPTPDAPVAGATPAASPDDSGGPERFRVEWQPAPTAGVDARVHAGERWTVAGADADLRAAWSHPLASSGVAVTWTTDDEVPGGSAPADRAIVVLPAGDVDDSAVERRSGQRQAASVLAAIHAVTATPATALWIVTRAGSGFMVEGLARVFALEHPGQWGGLIDLPAHPTAADLDAARAILTAPGETPRDSFFSVRDGAVFVPRLVADAHADETVARPAFKGDATYLVTGGLGAIGLHVAEWLAEGGAGRIVLLGRRAPSDDARRRLAAIPGPTEIVVVHADIASAEDMARVWPAIAESGKPLAGVVHAAGVVEPGGLDDLNAEALASLTRAKTAGALILHDATRGAALDFFVLFSSIASVWGTRGLGAYAAANRFLLLGRIDHAAAAFADLLKQFVAAHFVAGFFGKWNGSSRCPT